MPTRSRYLSYYRVLQVRYATVGLFISHSQVPKFRLKKKTTAQYMHLPFNFKFLRMLLQSSFVNTLDFKRHIPIT